MPNTTRIIVNTKDLERVAGDISDILSQFHDNSVIGKILAKELLASTDRAFKREADPNTGESWAEWSPNTPGACSSSINTPEIAKSMTGLHHAACRGIFP